jgi:sulfonate transport system substrate-binding protein
MKMMKTRIVAAVVAALLMTGLMAGCGGQKPAEKSAPAAKKVIRIAYQPSSSLTVLAKAKGFFEEEFAKDGIEVSYNQFVAGPPMVEGLAGQRLDIANLGPLPAISSRASGIDVKVVARAYSDDLYYGLLIRPDSPIKSVAELKGKKVAVQVGSGAHLFFMLLLQQNGLKNSDVNTVNLPTSEHRAALETGNVDAVVTWQPFVASLELAKSGKVLATSQNVLRTVGVYLARNEFAQQNPQLVERFLKVHKRAADYLAKNPDEALAVVSKENKIPVEALAKSVKTIDWSLQITDDDIKTLVQAKDFLKETNVLKKDFDINELVDRKFANSPGLK